jgi:hypothetical protein
MDAPCAIVVSMPDRSAGAEDRQPMSERNVARNTSGLESIATDLRLA